MLDNENTISRLESDTFKSALKAFIASALTIGGVLFGWQFDLIKIDHAINIAIVIMPSLYAMLQSKKAMTGRIEAESKVELLPWSDEIKNLIKKES